MAKERFNELPQVIKDCTTGWESRGLNAGGWDSGALITNNEAWHAVMLMIGASPGEGATQRNYYKSSIIISQGDHIYLDNLLRELEKM